MKGKSGIKDCPRCGLRNRLSAVTCDFCGYQFPRVDEGVENYIDTLDRLSKETAYRMNDDVSEKIRSTLKSPTDAPAARKVIDDPDPRIPDSVVATTLVSIPKAVETVGPGADDGVQITGLPNDDPVTAKAPELPEGPSDIDAPEREDVVDGATWTQEGTLESAPLEGIVDEIDEPVPTTAEQVDADEADVGYDEGPIAEVPEDEGAMDPITALATASMADDDGAVDDAAVEPVSTGTVESGPAEASEGDVSDVPVDPIAALATASMAEDEDIVELSTPDLGIEDAGPGTETVVDETTGSIEVQNAPETVMGIVPGQTDVTPGAVSEGIATTPSEAVPGEASAAEPRTVGVRDGTGRFMTWGGLALLCSGAAIYAGLIGLHTVSGDSIAYAWGGGVIGAALMSFGAYLLSARLFKDDVPMSAPPVAVASSREVVLCPRCYEIVSDDDRTCPSCGAEFKDDD